MNSGFEMERLGRATVRPPISLSTVPGALLADSNPDDAGVIADLERDCFQEQRLSSDTGPRLLRGEDPRIPLRFLGSFAMRSVGAGSSMGRTS